jgi:hypothetical protein
MDLICAAWQVLRLPTTDQNRLLAAHDPPRRAVVF